LSSSFPLSSLISAPEAVHQGITSGSLMIPGIHNQHQPSSLLINTYVE
jgi:hypothetical protein